MLPNLDIVLKHEVVESPITPRALPKNAAQAVPAADGDVNVISNLDRHS